MMMFTAFYRKKWQKKAGKRYGPYWQLVQSVRFGKKVSQKFLAHVGKVQRVDLESVEKCLADRDHDVTAALELYRSGKPFLVLDTETTGFSWDKGDRIIEISVQKFEHRGNKIIFGDKISTYVNPLRYIPRMVTEVNHINNEMVRHSPIIDQVIRQIHAFIGKGPVIGHNVGFDFRFLDAEFKRAGLSVVNPDRLIDTMKLSRRLYKDKRMTHKLSACAKRERIAYYQPAHAHDALYDVQTTAGIFLSMAKKLDENI